VGRPVNVLEIGIYSGGSLEMWRAYFGEKCHVYGVDIEPACRSYEDDHVSVFIGDQEDRAFWRGVREKIEGIDIVIDDGGHTPGQQQVTLEELLPFVRPGGVYVCEDVHGRFNHFTAFVAGLVDEMNHSDPIPGPLLQHRISPWQASIQSLHVYPHMVVIEKHDTALTRLVAPKHGTEWQPFL
jgi:SAM-dependent methyltransferase